MHANHQKYKALVPGSVFKCPQEVLKTLKPKRHSPIKMGRNKHVCLKLLITSILLVISCSAQQEGDATGSPGELNQKWNDFKVEYGVKSITQGPSNAVAEIGKQVKLTCTAETPIAYWAFSKDGSDTDMQIIVGPGCYTINAPFGDHYALESIGGGTTCNLIVFEITMEQAGVYSCTEAQNNLFSILTVIDSPPAVTVNSTEPILEDEKVVITCSLSYEGSVAPAPTLRPQFYWKDFNGRNVSSSYDSTTETKAISQLIVTPDPFYNITPYTCHVYLQLIPPATSYYANNIPSANISVVSPTIEVLYGAQETGWGRYYKHITIGGITCEINEMWCYAQGNPPPSYEWFDTVENVSITKEYTFDLAEVDRNYTCVVNNTIRNVEYYDSLVLPGQNYSIIPDCRFPHNDSTWIAAIPVQGCGNGTCACSSDNDGFHLVCNANSFPSALYQWTGADNNANCPRVYDNVKTNGIYRCTAYFDQDSSNYTGNYIFPNGKSEKNVTECYQFKGIELPTA